MSGRAKDEKNEKSNISQHKKYEAKLEKQWQDYIKKTSEGWFENLSDGENEKREVKTVGWYPLRYEDSAARNVISVLDRYSPVSITPKGRKNKESAHKMKLVLQEVVNARHRKIITPLQEVMIVNDILNDSKFQPIESVGYQKVLDQAKFCFARDYKHDFRFGKEFYGYMRDCNTRGLIPDPENYYRSTIEKDSQRVFRDNKWQWPVPLDEVAYKNVILEKYKINDCKESSDKCQKDINVLSEETLKFISGGKNIVYGMIHDSLYPRRMAMLGVNVEKYLSNALNEHESKQGTSSSSTSSTSSSSEIVSTLVSSSNTNVFSSPPSGISSPAQDNLDPIFEAIPIKSDKIENGTELVPFSRTPVNRDISSPPSARQSHLQSSSAFTFRENNGTQPSKEKQEPSGEPGTEMAIIRQESSEPPILRFGQG